MASNAKSANNTQTDPLFITGQDPGKSLYIPNPHRTVQNYSTDMQDASLIQQKSFGGQTEFQIVPNTAQYILNCFLEFTINSGVITANTALLARWVDFLAYAAIEKIEIIFGPTQVQVFSGIALKELFREQKLSAEEREAFRSWELSFPGPVRQANLVTSNIQQKARIRVPFYFTHNTHVAQPQTLGQAQRILITWRPLQFVRRIVGGTITYSTQPFIDQQKLRYEAVHVEQVEAAQLSTMTNNQLGIMTLFKHVQEVEPQKDTSLVAGSNTVELKLDGLNAGTQTLFVGLRDQNDVSSPDNVNPWAWRGSVYDPNIRIRRVEVKVSGGNLKTVYDADEQILLAPANRNNKFAALSRLIMIDFSKHCDTFVDNAGQINFAGTSNPTIVITLDVAAGEAPFQQRWLLLALTNNLIRNYLGTLTRAMQ
jgi:Major capsid protein N-terminus